MEKQLTSSMKRRAIIGGAAYPSPCTIASKDTWKPPMLSIPVTEHINLPNTAIAPYIPNHKTIITKKLHITSPFSLLIIP